MPDEVRTGAIQGGERSEITPPQPAVPAQKLTPPAPPVPPTHTPATSPPGDRSIAQQVPTDPRFFQQPIGSRHLR